MRFKAANSATVTQRDNIRPSHMTATGGSFFSSKSEYTYWPAESMTPSLVRAVDGTAFTRPTVKYNNWPTENVKPGLLQVTGGVFKTNKIEYENWPTEFVQASLMQATGGSTT